MVTGNEELFDAALRHQIAIRRFTNGEVKKALALLNKADADLVSQLESRLARHANLPRGKFTTERLKFIMRDVRSLRAAGMQRMRTSVNSTLDEFAKTESAIERQMIRGSMPMDLELASVRPELLRAAVRAKPFQGRLLKDWWKTVASSDQAAITQAVQLGLIEGETVQQIVRRVRGTASTAFKNGTIAATRRNAEAVVRTSINHTSNAAREEVWKANSDIVEALRWTATLDGRTTIICIARDGTLFKIDDGPRPPAHVSCRSTMIPVIDGEAAVGQRPFITDTRTGRQRQLDFAKEARKQLRQEGVKGPLSSQQVTSKAGRIRKKWTAENVGRVPAETTYQQFLSRQSAAFQNDVLGTTKGALFRRGGLSVDKFVDTRGRTLTLDQLKGAHPEAFTKAGLG